VERLEQAVRGGIRTRGAGLRQLEGMGPTRITVAAGMEHRMWMRRGQRICGRAVSEFLSILCLKCQNFRVFCARKCHFFLCGATAPHPNKKSCLQGHWLAMTVDPAVNVFVYTHTRHTVTDTDTDTEHARGSGAARRFS
jgi:hypothetical protein